MRAPCTLCLCHVEVAQEVLSFARSAWTKIRTLKCGCSPGCHQAQLRSPTGQAGEWGSSHTFLRHRQRDYSESGSCDISAKLLYPEPKHRGHVALREGHHLLLKVTKWWHLILFSPEIHTFWAASECKNHEEHLEKPRSPCQTCVWKLHGWPLTVWGQSQHLAWADQVTHHVTSASGIKQWHTEYLNLSLVNQVCCLVNTVLSANHAP